MTGSEGRSSFWVTSAKWIRVVCLLVGMAVVLWLAGNVARGIVAEYWIYRYDDDLVNGGRTLSHAKENEAVVRYYEVNGQIINYQASAFGAVHSQKYGNRLHSWMSFALIYGWQGGVTQFIDYQKPWNDPANRDAFRRRVQVYESPFRKLPRHDADGYALAHIAGNVHVFGDSSYHVERDIPDGKSNTILAGDAAGNYQPWGKPGTDRDPALGINQTRDGFGGPWANGSAMMVFADGSVRSLEKGTSSSVLKALATPAGGEQLPADY